MNEAKSAQCGICGQPIDNGWVHGAVRGYKDFSTQSCYNPSPRIESAQPQLPPLPEAVGDLFTAAVSNRDFLDAYKESYYARGRQLLSALAGKELLLEAAQEVLLTLGRGGQVLGNAVTKLRKVCDETRR